MSCKNVASLPMGLHLPSVARLGKGQHSQYNIKSSKKRQCKVFDTLPFLHTNQKPRFFVRRSGTFDLVAVRDFGSEKRKKENKGHLSGRGPSICFRRTFGHSKAPLGLSLLTQTRIYHAAAQRPVSCRCACTAAGQLLANSGVFTPHPARRQSPLRRCGS